MRRKGPGWVRKGEEKQKLSEINKSRQARSLKTTAFWEEADPPTPHPPPCSANIVSPPPFDDKKKVLYSGSWFSWLCSKRNTRLKGKRIKVVEAPEPSTILWENYGYRR